MILERGRRNIEAGVILYVRPSLNSRAYLYKVSRKIEILADDSRFLIVKALLFFRGGVGSIKARVSCRKS